MKKKPNKLDLEDFNIEVFLLDVYNSAYKLGFITKNEYNDFVNNDTSYKNLSSRLRRKHGYL